MFTDSHSSTKYFHLQIWFNNINPFFYKHSTCMFWHFRPWKSSQYSDIWQRYLTKSCLCVRIALFSIILFCVFLWIPFVYFYYEEKDDDNTNKCSVRMHLLVDKDTSACSEAIHFTFQFIKGSTNPHSYHIFDMIINKSKFPSFYFCARCCITPHQYQLMFYQHIVW